VPPDEEFPEGGRQAVQGGFDPAAQLLQLVLAADGRGLVGDLDALGLRRSRRATGRSTSSALFFLRQ